MLIDIKTNAKKSNSGLVKKTLSIQDSLLDFKDILKAKNVFFKHNEGKKNLIDVNNFLKKDSKSNTKTKKSNIDAQDICFAVAPVVLQHQPEQKIIAETPQVTISNGLELSDLDVGKSNEVKISLDMMNKSHDDNKPIEINLFMKESKKTIKLVNAPLLNKKSDILPKQHVDHTKLDLVKNINNDGLNNLRAHSNPGPDIINNFVKDIKVKKPTTNNIFLGNRYVNESIKLASLPSAKNLENKINKLVEFVTQISKSPEARLDVANDSSGKLNVNDKVNIEMSKKVAALSDPIKIKHSEEHLVEPIISKPNKKADHLEMPVSTINGAKVKKAEIHSKDLPSKIIADALNNNTNRDIKQDLSYEKDSKNFPKLSKSQTNKEIPLEKIKDKKEVVLDKPVSLNIKKKQDNSGFVSLNMNSSFPVTKQVNTDKVINVVPLNHIADIKFTNIKSNGVLRHMDIVLKPDGLGKVTAQMQFHDDKLVVEIKAENKETARLLSLNEKILKDNIFKENINSNKDVHIVITSKDDIKSMSETRQENSSSFNNHNRSQQFTQDFSGNNSQADHFDRRFSKKPSYLDNNEEILGLNGNIDEDKSKTSSDHLLVI